MLCVCLCVLCLLFNDAVNSQCYRLMNYWEWSIAGMILTGKPEFVGEKSVPVSFCLPKIPHRLDWPGFEPDLHGERLATCCTLSEVCYIYMYTIFRDLSVLPFQVACCHLGEISRSVIFLFLVTISVVWGCRHDFEFCANSFNYWIIVTCAYQVYMAK